MQTPSIRAALLGALMALVFPELAAAGQESPAITAAESAAEMSRIQTSVTALAKQLGELCPTAAPDDQAAFDRCRHALFGNSLLRDRLSRILLWGRSRGLPLNQTTLTQFAPDVYAGLYAPLFMFDGTAQVVYDDSEKLYKATLPARFRNRLKPGEFPYPFWHDQTKWSGYQSATAIVFYLDPKTEKIKVAQFLPGKPSDEVAAQSAEQAADFDGHWLWTDADGRTQPQVTLFDGLYSPDNPYLRQVDASYKKLALGLREGQCLSCHAPDNRSSLKRVVLLQTPAHAAGEIKRVLRSVRDGRMPLDDLGVEKPLAKNVKASLLKDAEAFDAVLTSAKQWEAKHPAVAR